MCPRKCGQEGVEVEIEERRGQSRREKRKGEKESVCNKSDERGERFGAKGYTVHVYYTTRSSLTMDVF